ncbi:MAG TPA: TRAP transporter small permease [Alphaproteobacteria bacterium]|nr:TRAP transporter small permease [Alphaproteobacteria bacterium]
MIRAFRKAMDALYLASALIASVALVLISAVIPWGVYTRYVLNHAASWPEPMAVLLAIVLTFFGAAACYRVNIHMRVAVLSYLLPPLGKRLLDMLVELLMGLISVFMVIWGIGLVETTWYQVIAEFPTLSVGVTYLPIPIGGAITLLFVLERLLIGPPQTDVAGAHGGGQGSVPVD